MKQNWTLDFSLLWWWNVVYDCLVFYLTVRRTVRQRKEARKNGFKVPLISILHNDGVYRIIQILTY